MKTASLSGSANLKVQEGVRRGGGWGGGWGGGGGGGGGRGGGGGGGGGEGTRDLRLRELLDSIVVSDKKGPS